ncbi:PstS family phosphate ABC transporter substrate-binding protein [Singulisphaera sp. PoT]|uniref:PstS family phosphate ABC transporter substrate-binding protein n=1 Tax=Singulisphaera sp. PoT TaxID=3411797 RepID=UPI003BF53EC2
MRISGRKGLSATLIALAMAGCGETGDDRPGAPAASSAAKTVEVDGSSTVFQISQAAREAYEKVKPDVNVVVDSHGTGGGFASYLKGEVDIVDASRPAKADEESKAKEQGLEWTRFLVGYDGITVVVNPKNTFAKGFTVEQLKKIWEPGSKVKTWKDVDPSWPDKAIVLYCPDTKSGTFEYFTEAIVGKAKSQREDVQASSDDNTLVNGVAGDDNGLGYFGFAYFIENKDKLRAVPIQKGADAPAVTPTHETILDKTYAPLSRPLYIFAKNSALRRPEVHGFVKFYLENIEDLAKKGGYVPPTAQDREANAKALPAGGEPEAPAAKAAL